MRSDACTLDETKFNKLDYRFSPDGRWVAYGSDESGQSEIYVTTFPRISENYQISLNGGGRPRWRHDEKAIFYVGPGGQLMEAEVSISGKAVKVGAVRPGFARVTAGGAYLYDISADGQRVLAAMPAQSEKPPAPVTLVENWLSTLKK